MHAMRAGMGHIGEESTRQLALGVEIPLLNIAFLRIAVSADPEIRSQRGAAVREHETRYVGSSQTGEVASRRSDNSTISERTRLGTAKVVWPPWGKYRRGLTDPATEPIQHGGGRDKPIVGSVQRRASKIYYVVVGVQPE